MKEESVKMTVEGSQFAVRLEWRGERDPHVCAQLLSEDDGQWLGVGNSFSAFWLEDLERVVKEARDVLSTQAFVKDEWGWRFKTP